MKHHFAFHTCHFGCQIQKKKHIKQSKT